MGDKEENGAAWGLPVLTVMNGTTITVFIDDVIQRIGQIKILAIYTALSPSFCV